MASSMRRHRELTERLLQEQRRLEIVESSMRELQPLLERLRADIESINEELQELENYAE